MTLIRADALLRALFVSLLVVLGIVGPSSIQSANAAPITIDITVELNGRHPNGMASWDGGRLYWIPFETSLQSPADLDIAIIQNGHTVFGAGDKGSICPERDACTIRGLSVDDARPFAILVLDYDGVLAEAASVAAAGAREAGALIIRTDEEAEESPTRLGRLARWAMRKTGRGLEEASSDLGGAGVPQYQLVDAAIFRPLREDDTDMPARAPEVLALEEELRALAARVVMPTLIWRGLARLEGEQSAWNLWDCMNALGGCSLSYSTIKLTEVYE